MKVCILASRCDTELGRPIAFPDAESAYKEMEKQFKENKDEDGFVDSHIDDIYAMIEFPSGVYAEWTITECEVPVEGMPSRNEQDGDKCPVCGTELCFLGNQTIENNSTRVDWECPGCGATGTQWNDIVFSEHLDVYDKSGKRINNLNS